MTIQFHYHRAATAIPHLGIEARQTLCHVFSDLEDVAAARAELLAWRAAVGFPGRLQRAGTRRQHFDVYFHWLEVCGTPVDRAVLRRWLDWSRPTSEPDADSP